MTDFGGRAMCPADEYDDLAIREEMIWHALEEALADAEMLDDLRWVDSFEIADALKHLIRGLKIGQTRGGMLFVGYQLTFRASTDDHLGEPDSLIDVTATLVPVGARA